MCFAQGMIFRNYEIDNQNLMRNRASRDHRDLTDFMNQRDRDYCIDLKHKLHGDHCGWRIAGFAAPQHSGAVGSIADIKQAVPSTLKL
jgi:hypothetical protein